VILDEFTQVVRMENAVKASFRSGTLPPQSVLQPNFDKHLIKIRNLMGAQYFTIVG